MARKRSKAVSIWLFIGCLMVLVQIIIGGITRLTNSGLSITEWEIIKGTVPPLNEQEWEASFVKYKTFAAKQYNSIHKDMSLAEFKKIYFWEYFHRLWARFMGFVFAIPFVFFLIKGKIDKKTIFRLIGVVFLASLSAIFGWLMVASGLNDDKRTWVNAYNLLIHLILATSLFAYLFYTFLKYSSSRLEQRIELRERKWFKIIGFLIVFQLAAGALMTGMKAALVFPYPFMVLKWELLTSFFADGSALSSIDWYDYEPNPIIKIMVQIVHRGTAHLILGLSIWVFIMNRVKMFIMSSYLFFYLFLFLQIVLGIFTAMNSVGSIPVVLGVLHQGVAFLVLASYLWILYSSRKRR